METLPPAALALVPHAGFFVGVFASVAALHVAFGRAVRFLKPTEQLVVDGFAGVTHFDGPGIKLINPFSYRSARVRQASALAEREFVSVQNTADGQERTEAGPQLLFLRPYDVAGSPHQGHVVARTEYLFIVDRTSGKKRILPGPTVFIPDPHETVAMYSAPILGRSEYLIVEDKLAGTQRVVKGPLAFFPNPDDEILERRTAIPLQQHEYVDLTDTATGRQWQQQGPSVVVLEPTWEMSGVKRAITLRAWEYVRLLDSATGKVVVHVGEQMLAPQPTDVVVSKPQAGLELRCHEFVKMLDQASGEVRVIRGPRHVVPGPSDKVLGSARAAVELDHEHAALVRAKGSGLLRLVTGAELFVPRADEEIEEVRRLTKLGAHEAMVIKDQHGHYGFYYGSANESAGGNPRAFFLPPYAEVATQLWSSGVRRDQRNLQIQVLDLRAQYMYFEFNCRTKDNVELVLDGTFFWKIADLEALMRTTGDVPGDVCNHARSEFIRLVSRKTLKEFMENCHDIAKQVHREDQAFYAKRGIKIWSLEVIGYRCAEESTSAILQEIIQETTNRMNRLSQAESENEVKMFRMQGMIEQEKMRSQLLAIQHEHAAAEAALAGGAEASRAGAFLRALAPAVPDVTERQRLWETLRRLDAAKALAGAQAHLCFPAESVAV